MMDIVVGHDKQEFTALEQVGGPIQPNQLIWSQVSTIDLQPKKEYT